MNFINGLGEFMNTILNNGTTGVACLNTGRKFIGIELDDNYFEIAKNRIEKAQLEKQSKLF